MEPGKSLYVQLFSIHGLVRGHDIEMGRDADTGGQIKYVIELANALDRHPRVRKVDIFTRLIQDKRYIDEYATPLESIGEKTRIIRIQCGGRRYMRKELLWPHLDEYTDRVLRFIQREDDLPDLVHGHYADGGYVAGEIADLLGVPFIFTGHSLGIPKEERLSGSGVSEEEMERNYKIRHRIHVETEILSRADVIVASTRQEADNQYGLYPNLDCSALHVIPPGINLETFIPFYDSELEAVHCESDREQMREARYFVEKQLSRFFLQPDKPLILALSRPDSKKNITGLVEAYGNDKELQMLANLAIFAGIRSEISTMPENERKVLTELLLLMDKYDLYGKMAIPKHHDSRYEVPELYRIAARSEGVFVNPAFTEPFGLTLIEAGASGLPIVATHDGGPQDIIANCRNGLLVDPTNKEELADAVKRILTDEQQWRQFSQCGIRHVRERYSWDRHCEDYLTAVDDLPDFPPSPMYADIDERSVGARLSTIDNLFITDIDGTLLGDEDAIRTLTRELDEHREELAFGVASGRTPESSLKILQEHGLPAPDIVIGSVGSEICYGPELRQDRGWRRHIEHRWEPDTVREVLDQFDFLELQPRDAQRPFKVSYFMQPDENQERLTQVHAALAEAKLRYNAIYSRGEFLDILPYRASKGKAVRYLNYKWMIPLENIITSGDTGNDEDMLRGKIRGIVVANHSPDLKPLRGRQQIYFAKTPHAAGILEGLRHYSILPGPTRQTATPR